MGKKKEVIKGDFIPTDEQLKTEVLTRDEFDAMNEHDKAYVIAQVKRRLT